jgi:hypothetical protein
MRRLLLAILGCASIGALAANPPLPSYLGLPAWPVYASSEVEYENYGQHEFTLRDKTEIHRGKL